jgi:hypothetical protein
MLAQALVTDAATVRTAEDATTLPKVLTTDAANDRLDDAVLAKAAARVTVDVKDKLLVADLIND